MIEIKKLLFSLFAGSIWILFFCGNSSIHKATASPELLHLNSLSHPGYPGHPGTALNHLIPAIDLRQGFDRHGPGHPGNLNHPGYPGYPGTALNYLIPAIDLRQGFDRHSPGHPGNLNHPGYPGYPGYPGNSTTTRIAILGCHKQFQPAPALVHYVEAEPDLCIWIGDNVYADTKDDPGFIQKCYDAMAAKPAFQELKESVPFVVTWDDHDYGLNNAGKEYSLKQESKKIFIDFWSLEDKIPSDRDGIYYSEIVNFEKHKAQFIMLDCRWDRDEPDTDGAMLGEAQWQWLEGVLQKKADLTFLCTGSQVLLDRESGSETWENYPSEMQRLFDMVKVSGKEHVVLITGDQHYGEVNRLDNAFGYDAIELQFSGINQRESPEFNSYRVSPVADSRHSMALMDIQWKDTDEEPAHILYRVYDTFNQKLELTYRINFSELKNQILSQQDGDF